MGCGENVRWHRLHAALSARSALLAEEEPRQKSIADARAVHVGANFRGAAGVVPRGSLRHLLAAQGLAANVCGGRLQYREQHSRVDVTQHAYLPQAWQDPAAGQECRPIIQHAANVRDNIEKFILKSWCSMSPRGKCDSNFETRPPTATCLGRHSTTQLQ